MSGPTPPRDQRVDAVIPVRFADAKEFLVEYTSNISLGGVFVRTASPAAFGTVVRLSLELPGTTQAVPVTGQVAFVLPADQAARQGKVPGMGVRFARLDSAVQETLAAYVEGLQRKSRGRVLLVDDDAVVSQKLADLLRSHNLNVTTVSSAIKALEILRFGGVDFICSDIVMPRMDGFEFRDNLRNNPKTANIPFIFLTSSDNPADMQLAAELGVQFFLRKPVEPGPLLTLLRQVLGEAAFLPEAPGGAQPPSEEKIKRKQTQDRRIVEIAYRKFVALGLDTRFTADERGVYGQLQLKTVNIQDPATGNRLERAGLYSVGHDRVKPFWPRALGALPMFAFLDIPDGPSLEKTLSSAFIRRIDATRQIKATLDAYRIPNRYDAAGMRMLGQVKSGTDQIVFSVRDPKTLLLESINGRSFGEVAQMRARLVDVSESRGGSDVEIALETAFRRLQQSMQTNAEPVAATALGADGRRSNVILTDLSADPDAPATAPATPRVATTPAAAQPPAGEWIGEQEGDQAIAAAAIDMATKAAIAASVGAAAAPLRHPERAQVEGLTPTPEEPAPVSEFAPATEEPAAVAEFAPASEEPAAVAEFAPASEEPAAVTEFAPASEEPAALAEFAPASDEPAAVAEFAPASEEPAAVAEFAPASEEPADVAEFAPASDEPADVAEFAPASEEPADVGEPLPPEAPAPPPADDIWPDSAPSAEAEAAPASSPFAEPFAADARHATEAPTGMDDWSAYATPDVSGEAAPVASEPELGEGANPEPIEGDSSAFGGQEFELAGANGSAASDELELEAPAPATAPVDEAWSARDEEAPADTSRPPEIEMEAGAASVRVQTDFSSLNDMESTQVPHSEPEPEPENLTPEEKQARDWADEWTGDVATAEPLWTIQPGEDAIKTSATVTDALDTPEVRGASAVEPSASAASSPTGTTGTNAMTAMVCTLCSSTYQIGDEIDDERLLLVCPSCIAKNLA